ncbi:type II secretion system protein [Candidatus Magnetominusculus xianensis]|uniref:Prepilin-type N-terminal cleavage/methylation domain-containing protein n=1 Tax=Candidatus Magnetominusculus xianensis TaxID=1748249 RepID=A0ABR5SFY1_9BACT|nr:type II secretion system protein [Candidatus Magnetominusculus xianensis]KWT86934.1 hypothetical protein ASN18_1406 [Candidatus Magnetominusculus xianensis]MBF0403942.1 type II secretion system protein [Nitrospirota bacterium]
MITNNDNKGFSLVEILVVMGILAILIGLLVYQFAGQKAKTNSEASTKQLFNDLSEARANALSQKNAYGIYLTATATANLNFTSYSMRSDSDSDGSITDTGGYATVRTTTLSQLGPLAVLNAITDITFDDKGFLSTTSPVELYTPCPNCDFSSVSNCKDLYADTLCSSVSATNCCRPADMSTTCTDSSFPESSCIVLSVNAIKMGKWCDTNQNGAYDSGECVLK